MPDFNERLAKLADTVRALPDGEKAARELMQIAGDVDTYLEQTKAKRFNQGVNVIEKYTEFLNASVEDSRRYHEECLSTARREFARKIAVDPRWQGGYADALALLADAPPAGG